MPNSQSSNLATAPWTYRFDLVSEATSIGFAADIARALQEGDVLALDGDLGAGKSTFARALLRARAHDPALEVPSPTFTLVQTYGFEDLEISHFDLYRISDVEELYEIGFEESWQNGAALIEWPDRAEDLMPHDALWLKIETTKTPGMRRLTITADSNWEVRLKRICEKRNLLIRIGWGEALLTPIDGDLSPRHYDRVTRLALDDDDLPVSEPRSSHTGRAQSGILMDMPERQPGPQLSDGRTYDAVAHRVTSLAPVVTISQGLHQLGLRVPSIYGFDLAEGLMLWEDFGRERLTDDAGEPIAKRYLSVVRALAHLHEIKIPKSLDGAGGSFELPHYDIDAFTVELDVFLDHYWPHKHRCPCSEVDRLDYHALWQPLLRYLTESEQSLVLRDVQDPNCFWLGEARRTGPIGFIDYQDCLIGPSSYDLSALALDARVTIPDDLEAEMLSYYISLRRLDEEHADLLKAAYSLTAAQRTSKNLGAFARAANLAGRPGYLSHVPRSLKYLSKVLEHPLLSGLKDWYDSHDLLR